jgi:hypothetical protein
MVIRVRSMESGERPQVVVSTAFDVVAAADGGVDVFTVAAKQLRGPGTVEARDGIVERGHAG